MMANIGVLIAAWLVNTLSSSWPDWIIAAVIATIVVNSSVKIINDARKELKSN
jgi:Co/Zn/Cd efflux system component